MKIRERRLLFYDFEVTPNLWMVTFASYPERKIITIINDKKQLQEFYERAKEFIWCGFNNRQYDDTILKSILMGKNPHRISVELVMNNKKPYQILPKEHKNIQLYSFDISDRFHSLKQFELFMGLSIKESEVSFDKEKLTDEEIEELKKYNIHDVLSTIEVFERLKDEFNAMIELIEMFNLPHEYINKTKAQMGAIILGAKKVERDDEWNLIFPDSLELGKYEYVKYWFKSDEAKEEKAKLVTEIGGLETTVAWGGLHSARKNIKEDGLLFNYDIASMYPATMIEWDTLSRNVRSREEFREIRDLRLKYKREKKQGLQYSLKILINSIFGASGDKYNDLYDARNKKLTCMYGQLFMIDLIDKIENNFDNIKFIQVNTDGLMVKLSSEEDLKKLETVIHEWEIRSRYEMERDDIESIVQKDVNNYIVKMGNSKIKAKGAMVKFNNDLDNDLAIVNIALREYFMNDILPEETINDCDELVKFQKCYKVTSNYVGAYHNGKLLPHKVYRVFASKNENNTAFYKLKKGKENPDLFAGSPEHVFIDNDDIRNKSVPSELDKQFYINLAYDRIRQFEGKPKIKGSDENE